MDFFSRRNKKSPETSTKFWNRFERAQSSQKANYRGWGHSSGHERPGINSVLNPRKFKTSTPPSLQGTLTSAHELLKTRAEWAETFATSPAGSGTTWRKKGKVDTIKKPNTEKEDVQKRKFSFQLYLYLSRGPSKPKCINKSKGEIPGLVYTVANKAENPFSIGSE